MTINLPQRHRDENGNWVSGGQPLYVPVDRRKHLLSWLNYYQQELSTKSWFYTRQTATKRIAEIQQELDALEA